MPIQEEYSMTTPFFSIHINMGKCALILYKGFAERLLDRLDGIELVQVMEYQIDTSIKELTRRVNILE